MEVKAFESGRLSVRVFKTRAEMGVAAAAMAEAAIRETQERRGAAGVIFAAAPSQNEVLASLAASIAIDWTRVEGFHLDEYAGLPDTHPASFRRFLRERILSRVPIRAFYPIQGEAPDPEAECERYAQLLAGHAPDVAILGIGENGHLAFVDPPVCDFADPRDVRTVELDEVCRMQQVHDGCFPRLEDVPKRALTMTIPAITRAPRIIAVVPGVAKQRAVQAAIEGPITTACPASVLRRHPNATLFLDRDSAELLRLG